MKKLISLSVVGLALSLSLPALAEYEDVLIVDSLESVGYSDFADGFVGGDPSVYAIDIKQIALNTVEKDATDVVLIGGEIPEKPTSEGLKIDDVIKPNFIEDANARVQDYVHRQVGNHLRGGLALSVDVDAVPIADG